MKGIKTYKAEHNFYDCCVEYEIDFDKKESPKGADTTNNIREMAEFWPGCPDKNKQELTTDKLNFFLKVSTARIIAELVMKDYISTPKIAIDEMKAKEGYYPLDGSHGVKITKVWGMAIPECDEYDVEIVE